MHWKCCITVYVWKNFFVRLAELLPTFRSDIAFFAAYGYFFFTCISVIVYAFEMTDICLTLKNDAENTCKARLAKSLVLAAEEVCLPVYLSTSTDLPYILCI